MPVKVDEDTVMKGISPGDRVDVMVFLKRNGADIPETGAFTILKNVRVFAVNTNTERATDAKGEAANFKTVSLLVKPDHARELAVAAADGQDHAHAASARRAGPDGRRRRSDAADRNSVWPLEAGHRSRSRIRLRTEPGTAFRIRAEMLWQQPAASPRRPAAEPAWKMEILTPADRKRIEWSQRIRISCPRNPRLAQPVFGRRSFQQQVSGTSSRHAGILDDPDHPAARQPAAPIARPTKNAN